MNKFNFLVVCITIICIATSCSEKNEDTFITTSVTQLDFENGGGSQTFTINSNSGWQISCTESWISVSPTKGNGNGEVTVSVADQVNFTALEGKIVIRTDDGKNTINIAIKLLGLIKDYPSENDKVLFVGNSVNFMHFDGSEGDKDSLIINSNIAWEIKGPEWIEAWDGQRWRPLSLDNSNVYGFGKQNVLIRTASSYSEPNVREGKITLSERLTGNYPIKIDVRQTGQNMVLINKGIALTMGFGMNWKCGPGVKTFYYKITEDMVNINYINEDEVRKNWKKGKPGSGAGWDGLKENTDYYLSTISEESMTSGDTKMFTIVLHTGSSIEQPFVSITDILLSDNYWHAKAEMNDYTFIYMAMGGGNNAYWATFNTPLLAYYMWTLTLNNPDVFAAWNSSGYVPLCQHESSFSSVQAVTWGMGHDGHMSTMLDRKQRKISSSATRSVMNDNYEGKKKDFISKEEMDTIKAEIRIIRPYWK